MVRKIRPKLTYANVMVTILAVLVIGGSGAYAAAKLKNGSVTTKKLANNSVTTKKLAGGAVTSAKIAGGAIIGSSIANGAVTASKAGDGVLRDMKIVSDREPDAGETDNASKQAFPTCPAGYQVTGGGGRIIGDAGAKNIIVTISEPIVDSGPGRGQWYLQAEALGGVAPGDDWALDATAVCVKAGS